MGEVSSFQCSLFTIYQSQNGSFFAEYTQPNFYFVLQQKGGTISQCEANIEMAAHFAVCIEFKSSKLASNFI